MAHHRISLIVDDEPAIRNYIRTILERECFDTVEAGTGKRGFELLQDLGPAVDLIVSDVHLPEGDGLTFARKAAQSFPGVPIIVISGYVSGYDAWPFEFLEKPFTPDSLLRIVRKVVAAQAA